MKKWLAGMACLFLLIGVMGIGLSKRYENTPSVPVFVLTYAENQADDYPTSLGAYRFSRLVWERTEGAVEIQVNTGGALGDEWEIIRQMQFGGVDFARVSLSPLSEFIPKLNVLQMPYLYNSSEHMWSVLEGDIGHEFLNSFEGSNLVALSWYDAGARSFYSSKKPIRTLEDVRGMRIRVQESGLMREMIKALGANAVSIKYGEVYSAFQTGEIEAAENNWSSYESTGHYEVAPYYTVDEHSRVPEVQIVSEITWDKLPEEYRNIIRECAQESARYEREEWEKYQKEAERKIRSQGNKVEVVNMPAEERLRFRQAVEPLYEKFCADYMDIVERIAEEGEKTER
ncbi:MAG: TRAP transporter substrate-binding protein [Lachnospiraceae bacterium]|jgi:tripartite ATP-independent transporter DctP family solute receptor|nr:TRAP transporter substrate-binding protein [Lachnospiraceae bacterium]MCI9591356.1 TRAP transporter substrate-binding protein [Lachnospiraceae bacterium]